jgi:hypothetical protein
MNSTIAHRKGANTSRGKEWVTADGEERYILLNSSYDQGTLEYTLQQQAISPISGDFNGEQQIVVPKQCIDAVLAMRLLVPISRAAQEGLLNIEGIETARNRLSRAVVGRKNRSEHRRKQ